MTQGTYRGVAYMVPAIGNTEKRMLSTEVRRTLRCSSVADREEPQERMTDKDTLAKNNEASKTDKRKQSLYFPESMLQEIKEEAARLDRSLSWVVQRAWKLARIDIKKLPSVNDVADDEDSGD
ncbi:TIGR04563 family protein [Sorangium sp. So ce315]